MTTDARHTSRIQHVTATGSAVAVALLPLVVGMMLARSVGADPMTSVNALITSGGQRARLSRCHLSAVRRPKLPNLPALPALSSLPVLRGR
ncbi:hypothetical protein ACGFYP_04555 [Streptomyces sp. NPDC048370]|uniref:hypothetical protein n=1 Tax=unclassified Streptomyces TaxID=2593676 RepID=UPI0034033498